MRKVSVNMKFILCAVVLLGFDVQASEDYGWGRGRSNTNGAVPFNYDRNPQNSHRNTYLDHRDDDRYDVHETRPCSTNDINCIRRFLEQNFGCSRIHEVPGPAIVKRLTMNIPLANTSFTINNAELKGLNTGKISAFHIDKRTDTMVLEVSFNNIIVDSPLTNIVYHRRGKAPVQAADWTWIDFKRISYTWTVSPMHDRHRAESHVYAYLASQEIPLKMGPGANANGLTSVNRLLEERLALIAREAIVQQAPVFLDAYLRTRVCKLPRHILQSD